ncbi:putative TonB-dependent receptor precursor [Tsuneonella dongtanensis]|uniref:Putative TonB-dependent receptor n=1 Tax=Tsuneonella dongtanensis TaxID=692370 RepID=A0A1B2AAL9_9SPHN|nr:TonB-dependent receptor [Tsuneonella dongtanensis]ANY19207.1 putative TonB-dependent receptor precursor [Tsuneonella dongtanensis]
MTLYHPIALRAALLASSLLAAPAFAQDAPPRPTDDDYHSRSNDEIVVTAGGLTQLDTLAGTSVMEGIELQRSMAGQVGEVLAREPGVTASGFAPGASRPVLRGFSGERVKVLVDGIGAIDASNTSADHAVSIDPLTAERIEVLRGPAVLLYGSQAIGGAVNVIDKRIPQRRLDEPFHLDAAASADTAYNLLEGGASLDVALGGGFVVHADGSWRDTDDMRIPGFVVSPRLRAELLEEAEEEAAEGHDDEAAELREAAGLFSVLPSSFTRTWSANGGFAFFQGDSNLGVSAGIYDTLYGVPGRPGAGHAHGDEGEAGEEEGEVPISIGLRQYRADLRGSLALGEGPFKALNTRVGYSDYTHTEFEGDETGTVFDVEGVEARAELIQNRRGTWQGSLGLQYTFRDFRATGAEAYVPPNLTDQFALFALQEVEAGPVHVELAGRYERTQVSSSPLGFARDFDAFSGAVGLAHETEQGLRFGANLSRVARAPSAEELLADGAHIATQAYEIGNPDLGIERAWGLEGFVRGRIGPGTISVAAYRTRFSGYIYQQETGDEIDGLPVLETVQRGVIYSGLEGELTYPIIDSGPFTLLADLRGDYVRASLKDGTPLPRIPPVSLLGALEARTDRFDLRGEVQRFFAQDRVAPNETPTDGFTFVNASIAWKPVTGDDTVTVLLQADNIFDVEGRRHASFTKDFVPLAGRNVKLSVRASF